jgi:threonine dehydrogenase-like Zn-dependent dehydrogenase
MKALVINPGTPGLHMVDRPEPQIGADHEIKMRVVRVGICGTDREEVAGGRADAPAGHTDLVIGHEMLGQVTEVGKAVTRVKPGDYAIFTVRRGCGHCEPCRMNRSDMCETGDYTERGIKGLDGYQTEYVVDCEEYVVRVPPQLAPIAVLTEPLTIAEKAVEEAQRVQMTRLPNGLANVNWLHGRCCLVAGMGPVGLLAALVLTLRGAEVYGLDIVDESSPRPQWLAAIGGHYIDGRQVSPEHVDDAVGHMDLIFEATGVPDLAFNLLDALAINGIYTLTGIPGGDTCLDLPGAQLMRELVLDNQVMMGSVNAARGHFQMAVDDLEEAYLRWGDHIGKLITQHFAYTDFEKAFGHHGADEIKVAIEWPQGR